MIKIITQLNWSDGAPAPSSVSFAASTSCWLFSFSCLFPAMGRRAGPTLHPHSWASPVPTPSSWGWFCIARRVAIPDKANARRIGSARPGIRSFGWPNVVPTANRYPVLLCWGGPRTRRSFKSEAKLFRPGFAAFLLGPSQVYWILGRLLGLVCCLNVF